MEKTDEHKFLTVDGVVYVDVASIIKSLDKILMSIQGEEIHQELMKDRGDGGDGLVNKGGD